jgi:hypothetical protein
LTPDGIKLMIRKIVTSDMASGKLNGAYQQMQNGLNGVSYS